MLCGVQWSKITFGLAVPLIPMCWAVVAVTYSVLARDDLLNTGTIDGGSIGLLGSGHAAVDGACESTNREKQEYFCGLL